MTIPFDATAGNRSRMDRLYGAYPAVVIGIGDPEGLGRVKIALPSVPDGKGERYEAWARLATLMAGNNRGTWFIPDVDDEVLVIFEAGDPARPCVIGSLWSGRDTPPGTMDGSSNNYKKIICSRNGVRITLDDQDGQEKFEVETPGGQKLTMKDGTGGIELVDANGNSLKFEPAGITVTASSKVTISASSIEISAGSVKVNTGSAVFSGNVQCDTIKANSVVASSYTPGAGNIS